MLEREPMEDPTATVTTYGDPTRSAASVSPTGEQDGELLRAGTSVGRYVVMAHVGAGGMGRVYAAYDPELDRKVALKLLRAERNDDVGRNRLVGEARALAKLAHPHVVAVHDAGTVGEQVFVAMEYVSGITLRQVLTQRRHGWRQVLELLLPVAHGLAAVHAAGLVHRDLKPDNIMLGDDGRVRVMDFGLARVPRLAARDEEATGRIALAEPEPEPEALTRTGVRLGTPAYMAPEQWRGLPADARTDQHAYCVTLWEALHGERPFADGTIAELERAITGGVVSSPARAGEVPRWLRRVLARGLAVEPAERHPSMDALVAAIASGRRGARLRWGAVGALVVGSAVVGWGLGSSSEPSAVVAPCEGLAAELDGVWDPLRRDAARQALEATAVPYAAATWTAVSTTLDRWAEQWVEHSTRACIATRVQGVQSEELLDRSRACLSRRREEVRGLVERLVHADAELAVHAAEAVERLSPLSSCTDPDALLGALPPPSSAQAQRVAEIRADVDRVGVLLDAVELDDAEQTLATRMAEADALGYVPLQVEVRRARMRVHRARGRGAEERALALEALGLAASVGDAEQATSLRLALVGTTISLSRLDEALLMVELVETELRRPGQARQLAELRTEQGWLHTARSELPRARQAFELAVATLEQLPGSHELGIAAALHASSYVALLEGRLDEALELAQRSSMLVQARVGPDHPELVRPLTAIGDALMAQARYDEAFATYERALALVERSLGPAHLEAGKCHWSMGDIETNRERHEAARIHYERALAITEVASGPDHPNTAECMVRVAASRSGAGRPEEAEVLLRRAIEIHERHSGPASYLTLRARSDLGLLRARVDPDEGLAALTEVVAIAERSLGEGNELVRTLEVLGGTALEVGRPELAIEPLTRALALSDRGMTGPDQRAALVKMLEEARSVAPAPRRPRAAAP
jgi:tetratricopeptide (TPR) repeat protein